MLTDFEVGEDDLTTCTVTMLAALIKHQARLTSNIKAAQRKPGTTSSSPVRSGQRTRKTAVKGKAH